MNKMGFISMLLSLVLGVLLIFIGIRRKKFNFLYNILILLGFLLIIFSIYLALPH